MAPHTSILSKKFPHSIMLVGEYGVMAGGSALTIPFQNFQVRLRNAGDIPYGIEDDNSQSFTCFSSTPLYFKQDGTIQKVDFDPAKVQGDYRLFLLDSGERFDTGPLVKHFLKQMEIPVFASSIRNEYLVINQKLIETLLGYRDADPGMLIRVLSDYQYTHFRKMIPSNMLDLWIEGQVTNEYHFKLNGSDGGLMLGITHQNSAESLEERWKQDLIWIE